MKYEIWISPIEANNQSKPQVHKKQWLSIYWFHTSTNTLNIKTISPSIQEFRIWAIEIEIPLYKQPKIEELSDLLDQKSNI